MSALDEAGYALHRLLAYADVADGTIIDIRVKDPRSKALLVSEIKRNLEPKNMVVSGPDEYDNFKFYGIKFRVKVQQPYD